MAVDPPLADDEFENASWMGGRRGVGVHSQPKVSYFFPKGVGEYHFGERHPMKPQRLTLTNHLVLGYGLHNYMDIYQPRTATEEELQSFHDEDYIDFLSRVTPQNVTQFSNVLSKFNIGDDCPVFDGMYDYFKQYAGASIAAGKKLAAGNTDIAINWTGGLHHAKKFEASGFCYINDIVLAILELLRVHARVLYIDIDIHHGDGVQEAFYNSNRVLTVSFHKYAESFFPGTGHIDEIGNQIGKYFSLNIPLQDGIDNESYVSLFKTIMEPTIYTFRPSVIVLQCGADSLGCDRLGAFNLSIAAHGECVRFIKAFNIPLLVLGGGGYTVKNVARCWTYETAVLLDKQHTLSQFLPSTAYDSFFAPDYKLHPPISGRVENQNTRKDLERIRVGILERLRFMHGAPSVQMQEIPPDLSTWLAKETEIREKEQKDQEDASNDRDAAEEKATLLSQNHGRPHSAAPISLLSSGAPSTARKTASRKPSGQNRNAKSAGNTAATSTPSTGPADDTAVAAASNINGSNPALMTPVAATPAQKAAANRRRRRNTATQQEIASAFSGPTPSDNAPPNDDGMAVDNNATTAPADETITSNTT